MEQQLRELLTRARPTWTPKDVEAVQSKLRRIGVESIPELLLELKANSLNESLRSKGEKRFCRETLSALKKSANHWTKSQETRDRGRKARRKPEKPLETRLVPKGVASRSLDELSDADLWIEYMSEGIAPPSSERKRADLMAMLQAVRSWRSASSLELCEVCWRFGIKASSSEPQEVLCQRLKNKTWEAWDIPIQRFLGNGDMSAAYALLEHFQELELMSSDELIVLCQKKGVPIEGRAEQVPMKERLKLVAAWEQLPLAELETECYRRGLPTPVPLPGATCPSRAELLWILLQGMHREALARILDAESCADDELSAEDETNDAFRCPECLRWAQPEGEAAWVDGHKCCDACAWRIYYEEREKEEAWSRSCEEDLDEAEVFQWMTTWRASRRGSTTSPEPAPEPCCEEHGPEIFTDSDGEQTDVSTWGRHFEEQIVCQHFERQILAGLKDTDETERTPAWHFIADLPTDASDGEEVYTDHWNFRQLWREDPGPSEPPDPKTAAPAPPALRDAPVLGAPRAASPCRLETEPSSTSLRACFCYASPLEKGLRELNVRAEWEAMESAEGLNVEVRSCSTESLQEVLLSKSRPEILHIAAHCAEVEGDHESSRIVLESSDGSAHVLSAQSLVELGWWDGVQLLVFLACSSQTLVQRLVQCRGLRRAVCCSAVVLDAASHVFCRTFYRALGAGQALSRSFEVAQAAIRHTNKAFHSEAGKFVLLGSDGQWPVREAPSLPPTLWPSWPRVEDYVGRENFTVSLANLLEHRRAVCLWGPEGSGKTALCLEFCRFFSAPGRRFAQGCFHLKARQVAAAGLLEVLQQQLKPNRRVSSNRELFQLVEEVDSFRRPWLLVVDGLCAADVATSEMLSQLLAETTHLHLLLTTRDPKDISRMMGYSKVVDLPLPHLEPSDSAVLLARRARRPLFRRDFEHGAGSSGPLRMGKQLLQQLRESPVMRRVKGHPGQILCAAGMVGQELHSLLQHPLLELERVGTTEVADAFSVAAVRVSTWQETE